MEKVGILTFYRANNYGAILQAYALNKYLTKKRFLVEDIDYWPKGMEKVVRKNNFIGTLKNIAAIFLDIDRRKKFDKFINNNISLSKKCNSMKEVTNITNNYHYIIVGSDQVWNEEIVKGNLPLYFFSFNTKAKKLSYAASFGKENFTGNEIEYIKSELPKYKCISVRENSAKENLNNLGIDNVNVVLDPTMLLTKKEWMKFCKKKKEKYVLVYLLELSDEIIDITNRICDSLGLKVVYFTRLNRFKNPLYSAYKSGPDEFVNLFYNAEFVVTNSFHGTVFSIIFNKQFISVPHSTRNTRQKTLLESLDLLDREYNSLNNDINHFVMNKINYNLVNKKLDELRKFSYEFLDNLKRDNNE